MHKTVFIDLETTGLNPSTARPIQIAMVAVNRETLEQFDSLEVKIEFVESDADYSALDRNHYDAKVWRREAMTAHVAISTVSDFLNHHATWQRTSKAGKSYTTCEIAGHNVANYDAVILSRWFQGFKKICPAATWTTGPVDTMHMARCLDWLNGDEADPDGYSLGALCRRYDIEIGKEHDALEDVLATVELAKAMRKSL